MRPFAPLGFGETIAFLLPGVVAMRALAYFSPSVSRWFSSCAEGSAQLGAVLLVVIGAVAAGVTVSAVRWALLDCCCLRGCRRPLDYSAVDARRHAYDAVIQGRYRFYQFNSNMLVALMSLSAARLVKLGRPAWHGDALVVTLALLACLPVLAAASHDGLSRTYRELGSVLGGLRRGRSDQRNAKDGEEDGAGRGQEVDQEDGERPHQEDGNDEEGNEEVG